MIRVAFVDDKTSHLELLTEKFRLYEDIEIVLKETSGEAFIERLKKIPSALRPQVVFMDIDMPGMTGIEVIMNAKALFPDIHYLMFTIFEDDEKIFDAIRAGASGYLLKEEKGENLVNAVIQLMETGAVPMSPSVARRTLKLLSGATICSDTVSRGPIEEYDLTPREAEVLKLLVEGLDTQQIADRLFNSIYTIRKHIANIYLKLHVQSRAAATNLALKKKWFN